MSDESITPMKRAHIPAALLFITSWLLCNGARALTSKEQADAFHARGVAAEERGDLVAAENCYTLALRINAGHQAALASMEELYKRVPQELLLDTMVPTAAKVGWGSYQMNRYDAAKDAKLLLDGKPCDHFLYAHASSSISFEVPARCLRFSAIGFGPTIAGRKEYSWTYQVLADGKSIYQSNRLDTYPERKVVIEADLPSGTRTITLITDSCGPNFADHSVWAHPKLLRAGAIVGASKLASATPVPAANDLDPSSVFDGHRYQFVQGTVTWAEAKAKAEALGGHLATITSQQEQDFIVQLCASGMKLKDDMAWLGAIRAKAGDGWSWVTGEAFTYATWSPGNPSSKEVGDWLVLHQLGNRVQWNDFEARHPPSMMQRFLRGFVVEWEDPKILTPTLSPETQARLAQLEAQFKKAYSAAAASQHKKLHEQYDAQLAALATSLADKPAEAAAVNAVRYRLSAMLPSALPPAK